jgi:hypothetical protein
VTIHQATLQEPAVIVEVVEVVEAAEATEAAEEAAEAAEAWCDLTQIQ